ncbi:MAG: hypothetical protein AVO35_08315 [Candidatus Aegiribacteria sp. MLS_C]|nr:MAG: hypothetical protein AVO35_08315 [Candidatus Aegiribacteria sp. MLS_C]
MKAAILVLAGYLAADIFLEGGVAAAAVIGLSVLEFLFILVFRGERHASLLIEGVVLALVLTAGHFLASAGYPGSEYVLLEFVLGATLLVSALAGRPWLASLMRRFPGFSPEEGRLGSVSKDMGTMFLLHGAFTGAWLVLEGGIDVPVALGSFALLYLLVVIRTRSRLGHETLSGMPRLIVEDERRAVLVSGGRRLGTLEVEIGRVAIARRFRVGEGVEMHRFLADLEKALRSSGCLSVRIAEWDGDTLPLEISGYIESPAGWTRRL